MLYFLCYSIIRKKVIILNERIKELRKYLGLNQTDFGERIGVKQGSVAGYESGARTPIDSVVLSICREFNVSEEWLRYGTGEMFVELSREETIANFIGRILRDKEDSFRKRYIDMLSKLDDDGWEALEKVAAALGQIKKD